MRYCPDCTTEMQTQALDGLPRRVCPACGFIYWNNPLPVAGVAVIDKRGHILLVRRTVEPQIGWWNLPAGFVERGEAMEAGALREVLEESGLEVTLTGLLTTVGTAHPDRPWHSHTFVFFYGQPSGGRLAPGDDADMAQFFPPDDLPSAIAFRSNKIALARWQEDRASGLAQALGF